MANTFIKPTVIVKTVLGLLQREIVVPSLVWLNGLGDFAGAYNDTVSIRLPARTTANTRNLRATGGGRTIAYSNLSQTKVDVTLNKDVYNAVPVTDEELSLDIMQFGEDILVPQVRAIAEGIEDAIVAEMKGATYETVLTIDPADPYASLVDARKALNDANVPKGGRSVVIGSAIEAAMLKADLFKRSDQGGPQAEMVRADGFLGRVAGFDLYPSNALDEDEGFAFHKTAFVLVTRAPAVPDGATFGATESYGGIGMRWLRDYDFANTQDRSLVDAFMGTATTKDNDAAYTVRAIRMEIKPSSIAVSPTASTKAATATQQLTVTETRSDGSTRNVTALATYVSADPTKATVSAAGLVTAVATGSSVVTATFAGRTATYTITVS